MGQICNSFSYCENFFSFWRLQEVPWLCDESKKMCSTFKVGVPSRRFCQIFLSKSLSGNFNGVTFVVNQPNCWKLLSLEKFWKVICGNRVWYLLLLNKQANPSSNIIRISKFIPLIRWSGFKFTPCLKLVRIMLETSYSARNCTHI